MVDLDRARAALERVLGTDHRATALYGLAALAAAIGDADDAFNLLSQAVALDGWVVFWTHQDCAWVDLRQTERFETVVGSA